MSNAQVISAVTATLCQIVTDAFGSDADDPELARVDGVTITALPPDRARANQTGDQVNVFLYHVSPSAALRNLTVTRGGVVTSGPPPLALDLFYLFTAYATNDEDRQAQRLLGRAMRVLHDHAVLQAADIPAAAAGAGLGEQLERVRLVPHAMGMEELSRLWQTFQTQYRLTTVYHASVVLIDGRTPTRAARPVLTRGSDDRITVAADLAGGPPSLDAVRAPYGAPAARAGETVVLIGTGLGRGAGTVRLVHTVPGGTYARTVRPGTTPGTFVFDVTEGGSALLAGTYRLAVEIATPGGAVLTNAVGFAVAPTITSLAASSGHVTIGFTPRIEARQQVAVLLGDRVLDVPVDDGAVDSPLVVDASGVAPGPCDVRLRVDGVDSLLVDRSVTPPAYDPSQRVMISDPVTVPPA